MRFAARPIDLELAGRQPGGHLGCDRTELIERPALSDPDVGLAPTVVQFDPGSRAASTIAVAVATARRDGLEMTRASGRSSPARAAASRRASARPVGDSGGSLIPQ
jgi:hypothetical protein